MEEYLRSQQDQDSNKKVDLDVYSRVERQRSEIGQLRDIARTSKASKDTVGPARPAPGTEYSESSSSEGDSDEEDKNILSNDPIFKQSLKEAIKQNADDKMEIKNNVVISNNNENEGSDEDEGEDDEERYFRESEKQVASFQDMFPISLEVTLKGHQKRVTTLTIDQSGSRLASGSNDYHVRLWDFNGMNQNMNSFRVFEPLEGHPIKSLSFNSNSQNLLVVGGGPQVCLASRDGRKGQVSIKGDMYITDMAKTKGHVSSVNTGMFHPQDYNIFATGSLDATVRIWDSEKKLHGIEQHMTHINLIKCSDQKGTKTEVDKIQYNKDGKIIMIGTLDGSLQGYSPQQCHRPAYCMRGAHAAKNEYGAIKFFNDGLRFVSRNCDGTLKLWDLRNFKKPVNYVDSLPSYTPGPGACISPDEKYIVTGTSVSKHVRERDAFLHFYDALTLDEVAKVKVGEQSISDMLWHPQLNQIIFGTGENISIYFDSVKSKKGALNCIHKKPRQITIEDLHNNRPVISPHALPLFKESHNYNPAKLYKKARLNPIVSHKPEQPIQGPGKAGRIGKSSTVTQFIMNTLASAPSNREDAQEALLKMKEHAEKNPLYITNAYKETQPVAVLDVEDRVKELEEQKYLQKLKDICPSCGLKICTCKERFKFDLK